MKLNLAPTLAAALAVTAVLLTFAVRESEKAHGQEAALPKSRTIEVNGTLLGKVAFLLQTDVVGMEGKEVVVERFELVPSGSTGRHYHPGHEVAFVLEGSATREMEGYPPMTFKAGDVMYIPAKHVHETKNTSTTEPLKVLFFRIHEKGQPISVRVTQPYFWK